MNLNEDIYTELEKLDLGDRAEILAKLITAKEEGGGRIFEDWQLARISLGELNNMYDILVRQPAEREAYPDVQEY